MSKDVSSYSENDLRLKGVQTPNILKSLGGPQNYKQNDVHDADYSQSKNKHLWTSFKHPNETT